MLASYLAADHANWITFGGNTVKPVEVATTAWMRVHLMGDTALRGRFYGPSCTLCQDSAWQAMRKMMERLANLPVDKWPEIPTAPSARL
jgi:hypothetical protein